MIATERTLILEFLAPRLETAVRNAYRYERLSKIQSDRGIDGAAAYWSNGVSFIKYLWFQAGGDAEASQAIENRIRKECKDEHTR